MGCGTKLLKIVLIIVNTIFFLAGAGILGVGLWIRFDKTIEDFRGNDGGLEQFQTTLHTAAYILIAFGAFTFLIGFCGCFGAIKSNKFLLGVYIFFVVCILGAEIAGGVYAFVTKDSLIDEFTSIAENYIKNKYNDSGNPDDSGWNYAMVVFKCCGVEGYKDFENSFYSNATGSKLMVPQVCCKQRNENTGEGGAVDYDACKVEVRNKTSDFKQLNNEGCKTKIIKFITANSTVLLGVAAGVAGFELLVLLAAIVFCCSIDKDD